ncbi:MAG: hypothetical protein M3460_09430 [Actinomycetota bacterium]|nr:hypothetical protein [Actinomycetota bacterium]
MPIQAKDGQQVTTANTPAEQAHVAADMTTQLTQDLIVQLVRQGLDISLKSLQVWADLTRQFGSTALRSPAGATMVFLAYDLFEKVLMAQRQVVDELVAAQRQFAQHFLKTTATVGGDLAPR